MKKNYYCRNRYGLQKVLRIMKITTFLCLISVIQVFAIPTLGQAKLDLRMKNTSIEEALQKIEENTNYRFFYQSKDMENKQLINIDFEERTVFEILDEVLPQLHLKYEVFDNYVAIKSAENDFNSQKSVREQKSVSGKVTDSSGLPLPGVTVIVKGTTQGAITNTDGTYTISNVPDDATLVFSFVGMKIQEVAVDGKTNINVTLTEDSIGIEEVVAIGYGTMKRSDITGSVASVKAEKLEELPISRVDQALQGQLSGVYVQNTSAAPNAGITIRIRGANSINGGNTPLVVIDGFQGGSLSTLAPNDIESIEVLKDASATAIYGSRGANGVILVTTKTGKKGKAVVSYDSYFNISQVRKKVDVMDAAQYARVVNENRIEYEQNPVFSDSQIAEFENTGGTNWQDEIFRSAFSHNQQLSIRGGNDNLRYYVSGGLVDKEGIVLNTSYKRYNLRSNVSTQINDKMKVDLNIYVSQEKDHPTALHAYGSSNGSSPIYSALVFAPVKPVYNENGEYTKPGGGYGPPTNPNPVAVAKEPVRNNFTNTTNLSADFEYNLAKGLLLNISGGYRLIDYENNSYINTKPLGNSGSEEAAITDGKRITLQNTNMITYNTVISDTHNLIFTGVYEQQIEKNNSNWSGSKGFFTDAVTYNNLGIGSLPQIPSSSISERALQSFMARINYTYKSKYLLTLTGRADASSVFGKNNKWGYFPSLALGWNVSSENFMNSIKDVISQFKIRASYGLTGNQGISPYSTLGLLKTNAFYPIDGTILSVGASLGDLANPDLKWEKTSQTNIGADLKFLNGRIELIADYYNKKTKDLLLSVPLPVASGGTARVLRNIGEVENKGLELYLGGSPVNGQFKWQTGITFGKNENEVVALRGDETSYALGDAGLPGFTNAKWLEVGYSLGLYKGYEYAGVWKTSEAEEAAIYGAFPGAPKFVDQNDDDKINSEDIVPIANAQPDFTYGWTNTFSYKNFDLNVLIQGVRGNDILNLGRVRMEISSSDADATSPLILNRWTPENEDTDVPSFTGQSSFSTLASSRWVEDGSYLRVKDITFGYTFPSALMQRLNVTSARIFISGSNLFTITNYTGFDPESSSGVDRSAGVDVAAYPSQKIYTVGLNLKF